MIFCCCLDLESKQQQQQQQDGDVPSIHLGEKSHFLPGGGGTGCRVHVSERSERLLAISSSCWTEQQLSRTLW